MFVKKLTVLQTPCISGTHLFWRNILSVSIVQQNLWHIWKVSTLPPCSLTSRHRATDLLFLLTSLFPTLAAPTEVNMHSQLLQHVGWGHIVVADPSEPSRSWQLLVPPLTWHIHLTCGHIHTQQWRQSEGMVTEVGIECWVRRGQWGGGGMAEWRLIAKEPATRSSTETFLQLSSLCGAKRRNHEAHNCHIPPAIIMIP